MREPAPFAFMHWAKTWVGRLPHCLGASGVPPPSPDAFPPAAAPYAGPNYYGSEPLREAIAATYGVGTDSVLVSEGTSLANYTALAVWAGAGERVLIEWPTYPVLADIPRFHGAVVEHLTRRPEDGWLPSLDDIHEAATRDGPPLTAVVLTRLHNPSGTDLPTSFLEGLAGLAEAHDFRVLLDEVFLDFLPATVPGHRFSPRFVTTASLTKVYGFGGLRVGWLIGDPSLLRPLKEFSLYLAVDGSHLSQATGVLVLQRRAELAQRSRELAAAGLAVVEEWVATRDDVSWVRPAGGITGFLRLRGREETTRFATSLRERRGVNIAEGEFFGFPGWIRVSFGLAPDRLREALGELGAALDE